MIHCRNDYFRQAGMPAPPDPWVDEELRRMGLPVESTVSGFLEEKELTRAVVVPKG